MSRQFYIGVLAGVFGALAVEIRDARFSDEKMTLYFNSKVSRAVEDGLINKDHLTVLCNREAEKFVDKIKIVNRMRIGK